MASAFVISVPSAADCKQIGRPSLDTVLTTVVTVLPLLGPAGLDISVGYHRERRHA